MQIRIASIKEIEEFDKLYPGSKISYATDFAILTGAITLENACSGERCFTDERMNERVKSAYRQGSYWTYKEVFDGPEKINSYKYSQLFGFIPSAAHCGYRTKGVRVALILDESEYRQIAKLKKNGIVELGYFPNAVAKPTGSKLNETNMHFSYNTSTLDKAQKHDMREVPVFMDEQGNGFITIKPVFFEESEPRRSLLLSDKQQYMDSEKVTIRVSPIEWLYNNNKRILLSRNVLIGGITFSTPEKKYDHYDLLEDYLHNYFAIEFLQNTAFSFTVPNNQRVPQVNEKNSTIRQNTKPVDNDTSIEVKRDQLLTLKEEECVRLDRLSSEREALLERKREYEQDREEHISQKDELEQVDRDIRTQLLAIDKQIKELLAKKAELERHLNSNHKLLASLTQTISTLESKIDELIKEIETNESEEMSRRQVLIGIEEKIGRFDTSSVGKVLIHTPVNQEGTRK